MPCRGVSPVSENLVLQDCLLCVYYVCCVCPVVAESCSPLVNGCLCLLRAVFGSCVLSGTVGLLGLELSQIRCLPELQCTLPMFSPERLSLVHGLQLDQMSAPRLLLEP